MRMHCNMNACVSMVCSIPPLAISRPTESSQNDGGNEDILSQKVYGKLSYVLYCMILYVYCSTMHACSVSIDGLVLLISISSYTSQ